MDQINPAVVQLEDRHLNQAMQLLASAFKGAEPMTKQQKPTPAEFVSFFGGLPQVCANNGLSFVIEGPGGDLRGVMLSATLEQEHAVPPVNPTPPSMAPIAKMLEDLHGGGGRVVHEPPANKVVHLIAVATSSSHTASGYATALLSSSIAAAEQQGLALAFAEATAPGTQHILLNKLGFECVNEIPYRIFQWEDQFIWGGISELASAKLVVLQLADHL